MKKLMFCAMTLCLVMCISPVSVMATVNPATVSMASDRPADTKRADKLTARLDEIKALDKSEMSASEKKALRKEVRGIKKELKEMAGGVYISIGALVIIALLLILLL